MDFVSDGKMGMYFPKEEKKFNYTDNFSCFSKPSPQPDKQRIEVRIDGKYHIGDNYFSLQFQSSKDFPTEKMEQIRSAIEAVLNDDKITAYFGLNVLPNPFKYKLEDIEKAFEAARKTYHVPGGWTGEAFTYKWFDDYKNTLEK